MTSKPQPQLRVISVEVRNVLGIREAAIDPNGRAVLVSGPNGSRKSSLLGAVQAALGGGSLARLQHVGSDEEPEVRLVLDGPAGHYRITKTGGETVRVQKRVGESAAFEDVPRPQSWLATLFDTRAANVVQLLLTPEKDLALLLLEALPLSVDRDELAGILGDHAKHVSNAEALRQLHPLDELGTIREGLFNVRTGVNRDRDGKRKAAEQTRRNTPAVPPADPADEIAEAEQEVAALAGRAAQAREAAESAWKTARAEAQAAHDVEEAKVVGAFKVWREQQLKAHEVKAAEIRAEAERQVAEHLRATASEISARQIADDDQLGVLDRQLDEGMAAAESASAGARAQVAQLERDLAAEREHLAGLRGQADAFAMARARVEDASRFDDEADQLEAEAEALSETIARLDAFRRRLADHLPIPGLSIEGREIKRDGVPWSQLNEGQRCEVVATVAMLRAQRNPLPLIFLDGLERLDTPHRSALIETLLAKGMQPFGAAVADGEGPEVRYIGAVESLEPAAVAAPAPTVAPAPARRARRLEA